MNEKEKFERTKPVVNVLVIANSIIADVLAAALANASKEDIAINPLKVSYPVNRANKKTIYRG